MIITENYECLVIHNNAKSNRLEDQVFWYKADNHEDFQLGAPKFWEHHSQNFNDNYDDDDNNDCSYMSVNKSKHKINVNKLDLYS